LCFTPTNTVYNVFFFQRFITNKQCTFKNNIKPHIFIFRVRPVKFLYLGIKICVLPTHTVYYFSFSSKDTYQRIRCTFKNNKKLYKITCFPFIQCALSSFFILTSKFMFYLLTQFTKFFLIPKVPLTEIGVLSKKNLKSHIFNFYSAPCQISLSLHQSFCFTYSHSLKFFLLPKVPTFIPIKE